MTRKRRLSKARIGPGEGDSVVDTARNNYNDAELDPDDTDEQAAIEADRRRSCVVDGKDQYGRRA